MYCLDVGHSWERANQGHREGGMPSALWPFDTGSAALLCIIISIPEDESSSSLTRPFIVSEPARLNHVNMPIGIAAKKTQIPVTSAFICFPSLTALDHKLNHHIVHPNFLAFSDGKGKGVV